MTKPTRVKGGWEIRLRTGKGRRETFRFPDLEEGVALERAARLERMRDLLVGANRYEEVSKLLTEAARVTDDDGLFEEAELVAQEIAGGKSLESVPLTPRTFRDVCDLWLNGELHRRYPHRVAAKKPDTVEKDRARLRRICETIGSIPVSRVTEADCDRAIAALPPLAPSTLAKYAQLLDYVLRLAASPMKVIAASPLPEGWVPSAGDRAEFQMLYPDEEAKLMRCEHLSIEQRCFWGFLAREGITLQEAYDLTWNEVDLERGTVRVVRSKTGRPRRWRMGDDVVRTLRATKPEDALPSDRVFAPKVERQRAAESFRLDLSNCGIDRPELHETTPTRRRIRAHDLRGTFVALSLAQGRSEQWIMDRTGHSQSSMVRVYDRDSRFAASANLGWFAPLDVLLGLGPGVGGDPQKTRRLSWYGESNADFPGEEPQPPQPETAAGRDERDAEEPIRHPRSGGGRESRPSGETLTQTKGAEDSVRSARGRDDISTAGVIAPSSAPADPLHQAIADLTASIRLAAEAGQWDLAARLHTQLDRVTAEASRVVSLDQRRKRNGDQ